MNLAGYLVMTRQYNQRISEEIYILVFWIVRPCSLVGVYEVFGGTFFLSLQHQMAAMAGNHLPDYMVSQI
jgi:hypothetical protein